MMAEMIAGKSLLTHIDLPNFYIGENESKTFLSDRRLAS